MTIAWFEEYTAAMRLRPEILSIYVEGLRKAGLPES